MYIYTLMVHSIYLDAFAVLDSTSMVHSESNNQANLISENSCETLFLCFWNVINIGFRNGEGIAALMLPESFASTNRSFFYGR